MQTFPESLSTGHCWIVQNDTFTALGTEIRETGTALLNLPMLPSYDKDSASLPASQWPSGLTSAVCKSGFYTEDTSISGRLNELPHGDSKLDSSVIAVQSLIDTLTLQSVYAFIQNTESAKGHLCEGYGAVPRFPQESQMSFQISPLDFHKFFKTPFKNMMEFSFGL